jgi:hypothetical protein
MLALAAGQALANHVHCGDAITHDTTLDSDLTNCPGDGIVIGDAADDLTLDLHGHTISGSGTDGHGTGVKAPGRSWEPLPDIRVTGGEITNFAGAIELDWTGDSSVADMRLSGNGFGLGTDWALSLSVTDTAITDNLGRGLGVHVATSGLDLTNLTVARNGGVGIDVSYGGDPALLADSTVSDNAGGGVYLYKFGQGVITRNRILRNASFGLAQTYCSGPVTKNLIAYNQGDGINQGYCGSDLAGNEILGNRGNGIEQWFGSLEATGNDIRANGVNGILVRSSDTPKTGAHLMGNRVSRNAVDGVHIDLSVPRPHDTERELFVAGNTVDRNGDDGIDNGNARTTLVGNHAWWNGDLGIESALGTLGGGNWAKHNGNPAQCVPALLCSTTGKPKG